MEITVTIDLCLRHLDTLERIMEKYDYTQEEAIYVCLGQFLTDYELLEKNKK